MKKVLFAMVAVVALTITSCCNKKCKETTCDKANTECVAADTCCKVACEKPCDKVCEKSCDKACDKACEKPCDKAKACDKK